MARNKIKRVAISDEKARKSTLRKRTQSLFKKVSELSILCGVDVVAIVQDPKDNDEIVSPSKEAVEENIARLLSLSDMERSKKMTTHRSFIVQSIKGNYEKCKRLAIKNDEKEMEYLMKDYTSGSARIQDWDVRQTDGLLTFLNNVLKSRNQELQNSEQQQQQHQEPQQLQQHQSSAYLVSNSNYYTPFLPPPPQELPFTESSTGATYPRHYSQQQQPELSFKESSAGAGHSHRYLQRQQEQLPQSNTTSFYLANSLNSESMVVLSCENCFMEMMFHNQNIMDLYLQHHAAVGFPQSNNAFGERSDMGFNQITSVDNVAKNSAFPSPPNENTNSSDEARSN